MKRVLGILVGASLVLSIGCAQPYDLRLEGTIKNMKYRQSLEKHTEEPPTNKTNLVNQKIFIRAPKGLKGPIEAFGFNIEQGKFDSAYTFLDPGKQVSLHILARTTTPKGPTTKKAPSPADGTDQATPTAVRGDFTTDVLDLIKSAYSTDVESSTLKPIDVPAQGTPKTVSYKGTTIELPSKDVKVYFYGAKTDPAQVALIFEGPKEALKSISSQINYSLNSLAVGTRATLLYSGGDEFATDEGGGGPMPF